jgi:RHS repeat-associated protein
MKGFILFLFGIMTCIGANAQGFSGTVTSAGPTSLGGWPNFGIFATPVGSQLSGTIALSEADFGTGTYYGGRGYNCVAGYSYTGSSGGAMSLSNGSGSASAAGMSGANFNDCNYTISLGSDQGSVSGAPGTVTSVSSQISLGCEIPGGGEPVLINYTASAVGILPLRFPTTSTPYAVCYGTASFSATVLINGEYVGYGISINLGTVYNGPGPGPIDQYRLNGSPSDQPVCTCAGDPITLPTGNVFAQETDYSTAGPNALAFVRSYNSQGNPASLAVSIGKRWRSNFDRYLRLSPTSVVGEGSDGQEITFTLANGLWSASTDVDMTLIQNGSQWTLTDRTDAVETYSTISSTEAILASSRSRNGYTQTLAHNSANQLMSVTDSYGRQLSLSYTNGLLQNMTTPDGLVITYSFGASGQQGNTLDRLSSVSYSTTPSTSRSYSYQNTTWPLSLTSVTDEDGNAYSSWTYDALNRATSSALGNQAEQMTIGYDPNTGNVTVTNPLGESTNYIFTGLQGILKVTEEDRQATTTTAFASRLFTYDSNGYVASQTDWNGNMTTFVNDVHGQPTTTVEAVDTPQARTTTTTYLSNFHLPSQIVQPGITTNFAYDSSGDLLTKTVTDTTTTTAPYSTNGQTRVSTFTYGNYGLIATAKTARSDVNGTTTYTYSEGVVTKIANALSQSANITNTAGGRPLTVVDANGVTTTFTYDSRQRLISRAVSTAAGTLTTSFGYDAAGNLLSTTLPDGSSLTNTFDTAHRLTKVTDSLGNYTSYTLDGLGDRTQTAVYTSGGKLTWQGSGTFDALGRELVHTAGAGQTTTKTYDSDSNILTVADGLSHTTTNTYDALNRLNSSTDANGGVTRPAYDTNDRIVVLTDANGNTTAYVRDGFGGVLQQSSPDSGLSIFQYDDDANLTSKTDALGIITNQTFDALDRVLTTSYPAHTAENVGYTYDQTTTGFTFGVGRLTSVTDAAGSATRTYDERGNLLAEKRVNGSATLTTGYTYDGASRVASMMYPDGTLATYQHNAAGYVSTVTVKPAGASATTTVATLTHQPFGPISRVIYGNSVGETWTFDQAYRPTSIVDALSGTNLQSLTYGYDAANNVKTLTDAVNVSNSQSFGYDLLNRLNSAISGTGGYGTQGWKYDSVGNRLEQTQGTATTTYGYTPGTNRLLTISNSTKTAQLFATPTLRPITRTGNYLWANSLSHDFKQTPQVKNAVKSRPVPYLLSGIFGWPILLTGFAGIFTLRKRLRVQRILACLSLAAILTGSSTLLSGCISGSTTISTAAPTHALTFAGVVHGGQQPVTGSTIQLYAVSPSGDGFPATPLLTTTVKTDSSGNFSITSDYACPSTATQVYLTATGGNPGLASGTNNIAIAMMAALGPCGALTPTTYIWVNELTTVGSLAALYPYMNSVSSLGFPETAQLTAAFAAVSEYTSTATGSVPGPALPSGYYAASIEIQTLGDAVAACINSDGSVTATSPCGMLFALANPIGGTAPTDTIGALLNILKNPTLNVAGILGLVNAAAPFQPALPFAPSSWNLPIAPLPAAPTFSVAAGTYSGSLNVALVGATGTSIYYTTDGTAPSAASPKYTGSIKVASTETINAIAEINPFVSSSTGAATYTISGSGSSSSVTVTTNSNGNITGVPSGDGVYYLTFTYNNANRPASVAGGAMAATFVYDWAGQRFSKTNGGMPPTIYSYSQDGAVIAENNGGTVTDYIYADGRPIAVIQPTATPAVNQIGYVMADNLGTPQRVTNTNGSTTWTTAYQPFGTTGTVNAAIQQDLRFPGQLADAETGFNYNHFRDYMPSEGRYLQTDLIDIWGGSDTFAYAGQNPIKFRDVIGLAADSTDVVPPTGPVSTHVLPLQGDSSNYLYTQADQDRDQQAWTDSWLLSFLASQGEVNLRTPTSPSPNIDPTGTVLQGILDVHNLLDRLLHPSKADQQDRGNNGTCPVTGPNQPQGTPQ